MAWNEDYEFNYRLRQRGKDRMVRSRTGGGLPPRGTFWTLARQYFNYGRGKSAVILRHPGSVRARHLAAPGLALGLVTGAALALAGFPWLLAALLLAYVPTLAVGAAGGGLAATGCGGHPPSLGAGGHAPKLGAGFFIPFPSYKGYVLGFQAGT